MQHKQDKKLAVILDIYAVADASPELLDRIMANVQCAPVYNLQSHARFLGRMNLSLILVAAVLGFWLGNASLTTKNGNSAYSSIYPSDSNFYNSLLEPKTWNEVVL